MQLRPRFDPSREFIAARGFVYLGTPYEPGDPFPTDGLNARQLERQYDARAINFAPPRPKPADLVVMTNTSGSWYEITAPWLDAPVKVNGKGGADAEAQRLRTAGPPEGWQPPAE